MRLKKSNVRQENLKNQCDGFTLIELSVVIIIVGLLTIPLLQYYKIFLINEEIINTQDNIAAAANAIQIFGIRYPCPSDRSLPPTDPNYGQEQCTGMPACDGSGTQGICITNGSRDVDGVGGIGNIDAERVIIGGLPSVADTSGGGGNFQQIPAMKMAYFLDGWGNKMTYAVSVALSDPAKTNTNADFNSGSISAISEHNIATAGINDDAQFVIVSHGKSGDGSFSLSGVNRPCVAGRVDTENCDDDSVFRQALGAYEGSGASFYDDHSYFYAKSAGELWYTVVNPNTGEQSPHINNINADNVGIDTDTPQVKLDVNGNILADTVRTNNICDITGTICVDMNLFIGSLNNNFCPEGQIIGSIGGGAGVCEYPAFSHSYDPITDTTQPLNFLLNCPVGYFVTSIKSNRCIACSNGTEVCAP